MKRAKIIEVGDKDQGPKYLKILVLLEVINATGRKSDNVIVEVKNTACGYIDKLKVNDTVSIHMDDDPVLSEGVNMHLALESHNYKGKWYTNAICYKITSV